MPRHRHPLERNIKAIITARRKVGEDITIHSWATQHAPVPGDGWTNTPISPIAGRSL
jgi:hypothetical protein